MINNNWIATWGGLGPGQPAGPITEFDTNGNLVLTVELKNGFVSYRAFKEKLPWELNRPVITCTEDSLIAPAGYESYEWNTGDTTRAIAISDTGEYQVWVNKGIGFLASEIETISDLQNPCGLSSNSLFDPERIIIYPNPATDFLYLDLNQPGNVRGTKVLLTDAFGRKFPITTLNSSQIKKVNLSNLGSGLYILSLEKDGEMLHSTKLLIQRK